MLGPLGFVESLPIVGKSLNQAQAKWSFGEGVTVWMRAMASHTMLRLIHLSEIKVCLHDLLLKDISSGGLREGGLTWDRRVWAFGILSGCRTGWRIILPLQASISYADGDVQTPWTSYILNHVR